MNILSTITDLSKQSPIIAGAISLWGLTVVTFLLKSVPSKIVLLIKRQLTSSLEIDNAQGWYQEKIYESCMDWFYRDKTALKLSRSLSIYTQGKYDETSRKDIIKPIIGPGYGIHLFKFKNKIMWIKVEKIESPGSDKQKRSVNISCIGRDKSIFDDFVKEFTPKVSVDDIFFYSLSSEGEWSREKCITKRPLESIAMDRSIKDDIIKDINHFNDSEEWFVSKGIPYKLTYVFHGKPGTGKTSLIKSIASYFNRNICSLNINSISDSSLRKAMSTVPSGSIVIMEDFDSSSSTRDRKSINISQGENNTTSFLSLTGILNALDGIDSLHDTILFMTTNHLEKVDPALYRKGRVDHILEIKEVSPVAVREYSEYIFPDYDFSGMIFKETLGCELNNALLCSKGDPDVYLGMLTAVDR